LGRLVFATLFVLVVAGFAQTWGPPSGAKPDYSLIYTGKLFGYFRYPDIQTSTDQGCPNVANAPLPPQVELLRTTLRQIHSENQELVAMGENFAPELLSRELRNNSPGTPHFGKLVSKDILTENGGKVSSDNVGCFLRLMGFDAIVPGQQDFYYGPEHLRQIARFLAQPGSAGYKPVQMLAANLVIRSTVRKQAPRLPISELPAQIRDALDDSVPFHFDLPSAVMPWLKEVAIAGRIPSPRVYDCLASADDPRNFKLPSDQENRCTELPGAEGDSQRFRFQPPARPSENFVPAYYSLDPGSNHALCVAYSETGQSKIHCQLFSVQYPFLQYLPASWGTTPAPYFVPANKGEAVVFGVLDPSLVGYIGQLSDVWMNTDRRFDTSAQTTDPLEALRQVLSLCDSDAACQGRHKILLAQMPYYKAAELAAKLKAFDIVIAQPDHKHAAGDQNTSLAATSTTPQLLTPGLVFDSNRKNPLSTNLRRVDYYAASNGSRFFANRVYDAELPSPNHEPCRTCALDAEVAKATAQPNPLGSSKGYEQLALKSMQEFCGADIGFLQHRDVFGGFEKAARLWPSGFQVTPQQLLDETLWKGDFAFCVPLKGSTIKKVLDESAAFDKQDQDNLSFTVEKGRGLSTLGIQTNPGSDERFIHGQPIDDNKLYGVAMTDYLAFGNTGYPELSSEAIQPVVRVVDLKGLNRLTGLACERLPNAFTNGYCQSDEISASDYFAAIQQRPFDTSRGVTEWLALRRWATHPLQVQPNQATLLAKQNPSPENAVANRGLWWFTLQNILFGYNLNFIRGSDRTVPGNFVGNNSFSQLSTPESSQFNIWGRARGGYSFPRFVDFYMSAEAKYSRLAVRNSANNGNFGDYQLTLANNLLRGEVGLTSKPLSERFPVRLLVSENLLTQPTEPFQQFAAAPPCGDVPCPDAQKSLATFYFPKNYLVLTRFGARLQNGQSWFEAGREYGTNIDIPGDYLILDLNSAHPFLCPIYAASTLSGCVSADPYFTTQSKIIPQLSTQGISGWFADFHSAVPLLRNKLQLTVDSYGEVFDRRRDDSSYNTRFYEDLTLGLNVPLWGNLALVPQVETFYYQNKVVPGASVPGEPAPINHYVFVSTSISLQYAFDWHRGVGLLRALRFPNGVSTTTSGAIPRP
jgi:5'-nucleotidase, C-terminal domain